jgi:hypothetical protein
VTREEAIRDAYTIGFLRWKLYVDQASVYDQIRAFLDNPDTQYEQYFVDIARQYGKTFIGILVADECARRHPGWAIRYVSYSRRGLQDFVLPNFATLLSDCPANLRPEFKYAESAFVYANGSRIGLYGANQGHEDDARGPRAHLIVNEECGFMDRLDYLVKSVELPQLTTTGGRILHITTPAETPAHESTAFKAACKAKGNYIKRTIDENLHITQRAKEKLIEEMGGRESTKARRELWCEDVTDEARAIVAEYTLAADTELVRPVPAIGWHFPLLAMDVGFEDLHFILAGYWDFARAVLCVQGEMALQRATTDRIAAGIQALEARLWRRPGNEAKRLDAITRWTDVDPRLVADLGHEHRLAVIQTAKDDLEAQVNAVRLLVKAKKIEIDPSCELLRRTLLQGIWNKARTQFEHAPGIGHSDAIAALIYMTRNANRSDNPYPAVPEGVTLATHHIPVSLLKPRSDEAQALRDAFVRRR